jgi:4,4'-diaponeurosporenoate glycosyltransferase
VLYAVYVAQLGVLFRRVGRFSPLSAAIYPVPLAFFVTVFLRSAVLTFVRHEVRWRGRTIRT